MALAPAMAQAATVSNSPAKTPTAFGHNGRTAPVHLTYTPGMTPFVTGSNGKIVGSVSETIYPSNGSAGTWQFGFDSSYTSGCGLFTCTMDVAMNSCNYWLGASPFNANSLNLTDQVWVNGYFVTVQTQQDPALGIYVSGYTVTFDSQDSNNWQLCRTYDSVGYSTDVAMWGPYESQAASVVFSYNTFYGVIN